MKELIKSISKKEWQFVAAMAVAMILLTGLPYLYGYLAAGSNEVYDGLHALSPGDVPVYYSYINQVKACNFFLKDLFTAEPQSLGTFNVWWFMVGITAKVFNWSAVFAFQFFRLLMIPVFILVAYLFLSYFLKTKIQRQLGLVFLLFSTGVGCYFSGFFNQVWRADSVPYRWPIDLWLTDAVVFNVLYQTSHFIASLTLVMLIFLLMLLAFEKQKINYAMISGFLALFYFNFHPYYVPVVFGVLGLYFFYLIIKAKKILWPAIGYLAILVLLSSPSIFYHLWLIKNSFVIGQRATQNITIISAPLFVIIGYGFLIPGFILGVWFLARKKQWNDAFTFLAIWLGFDVVLMYLPFNPFQSRYTQGVQPVLAIFTVIGLLGLFDWLKTKLKPKIFDFWINNPALLFFGFILFFASSNLYNLVRDVYYFSEKPGQIADTFYLSKDVTAAMDWLGVQPKSKIILANDISAKFIPAFSGQFAYVAHPQETLFYQAKIDYLIWIFGNNRDDLKKRAFLIKNQIDYIFYSQYEKALGDFNPAQKDYLKLVFDQPEAQIYEVTSR